MAGASRFEWVMLHHAPLVRSPAPRPSLQLLEPPCASCLLVPFHLVDPGPTSTPTATPRADCTADATSGDGLLLLDFVDLRDMDLLAAIEANAQAVRFGVEFGPEEPDILKFVCNPVSGEMFPLPDAGGMKKVPTKHSHGLLTHSARGHGPPDRYAVVEVRARIDRIAGTLVFTLRRFLLETGKWDKLVCSGLPRGLRLDRRLSSDHEMLAFAGRMWIIDVSWGALSFDPFIDRPDFRFIELPSGSVTDHVDVQQDGLVRYRRMGVSEGRLRYAEVTTEEP